LFERLTQLGLTTSRLILIAAGFITVYFGFTIVGNRVHQYGLDRENAQLEQRISTGQMQLSKLQALRDWMQSDSYVEQMARQQGMIRPGDHPVIVSAPPAASTQDDGREWWEHYLEPQ
jgi:hypothetical protein